MIERIVNSDANVKRIFILLLCFLLMSSCFSKPEDLIIGKWHRIKLENERPSLFYPTDVEFFKEGTCSMKGDSHLGEDMSVAGNFKFVDSNHVRIDATGFASTVFDVSVSRSELIMKSPSGGTATYRRDE
jgi:hypothetical protein